MKLQKHSEARQTLMEFASDALDLLWSEALCLLGLRAVGQLLYVFCPGVLAVLSKKDWMECACSILNGTRGPLCNL